jgi:hypothetical protein
MAALHGSGTERLVTPAGEGVEQFIYTDGCVASMETLLYGDLEEFVRVTGVIGLAGGDIFTKLWAEPSWSRALAAWQACLAAKGYVVSDVEDPIRQATEIYTSGVSLEEAHEREIQVAVDDAECAGQVDLTQIYGQLIRRFEAEYATEHEADLLSLQRLQEDAVERAKDLLTNP